MSSKSAPYFLVVLTMTLWSRGFTNPVHQPPIGMDNFAMIRERGYLYVDKSELIREVFESGTHVYLITRPRKFGKTTALTMIQNFFDLNKNEEVTHKLFKDLAINKNPDHKVFYNLQRCQHPVIFLSLKDCKVSTYNKTVNIVNDLLSELYREHKTHVCDSLGADDRLTYQSIVDGNSTAVKFEFALFYLTRFVYEHYRKESILLVDDYDSMFTDPPKSSLNKFQARTTELVRTMLSRAIKGNKYIFKAIITGTTVLEKGSIFSDPNNFDEATVLHPELSQYFGFTETEVKDLIAKSGTFVPFDALKAEYDGYQFGKFRIYNPWSILKAISTGRIDMYWSKTGSYKLVEKLIRKSGVDEKVKFDALFKKRAIQKIIDNRLDYDDIYSKESAFWSYFVHTGLLTAAFLHELKDTGAKVYNLTVPNLEVSKTLQTHVTPVYERILPEELLNKDPRVGQSLQTTELRPVIEHAWLYFHYSGHYHTFGPTAKETSYQAFMEGMFSIVSDEYQIETNVATEHGKIDLALYPFNKTLIGILFEFDKARSEKDLKQSSNRAIAKIFANKHPSDFFARGIKKVRAIGVGFYEKLLVMNHTLIAEGEEKILTRDNTASLFAKRKIGHPDVIEI